MPDISSDRGFLLPTALRLQNPPLASASASLVLGGHWIFVLYILVHFAVLLSQGNSASLAETHLPSGLSVDGLSGLIVIAVHVACALAILACGPLLLARKNRSRMPAVYKIGTYAYAAAVAVSVLGFLYLASTRDGFVDFLLRIWVHMESAFTLTYNF